MGEKKSYSYEFWNQNFAMNREMYANPFDTELMMLNMYVKALWMLGLFIGIF